MLVSMKSDIAVLLPYPSSPNDTPLFSDSSVSGLGTLMDFSVLRMGCFHVLRVKGSIPRLVSRQVW
jgi:hypothetical protein